MENYYFCTKIFMLKSKIPHEKCITTNLVNNMHAYKNNCNCKINILFKQTI